MVVAKKIYYSGVGGAFRVFISEKNDVFVIDFETSLSELENKFLKDSAQRLGFYHNITSFKPQDVDVSACCFEWYNLSDYFLNFIKDIKKDIFDINGQKIKLECLKNAAEASVKIRNKNFFYRMVNDINPDYLPDSWKIQKNINELTDYNDIGFPFIIKSCQGKGGKGNLVCYDEKDIECARKIFFSDLFAKKQEINTYNIEDEVIVEKFFHNCPSYNFSFYCDISGKMLYGYISEQVIDEVFYRGNIYPAGLNADQSNRINKIGLDICQYINKRFQYTGWIGLDFINVNGKVFVIEANPRVNSVIHVYKVAKGNPFVIRLMKYKSAEYINNVFDSFYFNHNTSTGIIPYQLPNDTEILIMSVAKHLDDAKQQLDVFAEKQGLEYVEQHINNGHSKSISYYLAKQK